MPTNARGVYLGDERLDPVLEKLNERQATVAIHPNEPKPAIKAMSEEVPPPLMEFIFDTTRTIIYMSQKNVFSKYLILNGLSLIAVHYYLSSLNVWLWVIRCLALKNNPMI